MNLLISEAAKLAGVSIRTLHYYDKIGLLSPGMVSETGYRYYDEVALEKLQQILFYRELDFTLKEIAAIMNASAFKKEEALKRQRELLYLKRERMDKLIGLLDAKLEGVNTVSFKEFDMSIIEDAKEKYAKEAKERWRNSEAYKQSKKKTDGYSKEDWAEQMEKSDVIMKKFAAMTGSSPKSQKVQNLVEEWRNFITESYYGCTKEILLGLGEMYMADERFTKNIDRFGAGTAELMSQAIKIYCAK